MDQLETVAFPLENSFYVVSPKDIVIGKPRDKNDHLQWLMEHEKYELALQVLEESSSATAGETNLPYTLLDVGERYMNVLMEIGRWWFVRARAVLPFFNRYSHNATTYRRLREGRESLPEDCERELGALGEMDLCLCIGEAAARKLTMTKTH